MDKGIKTNTQTFMSRFRITQKVATHLAITSTIRHQKIANNDLKFFYIQSWVPEHVQCLKSQAGKVPKRSESFP